MKARVEIPRDMPSIRGDRQTLVQAFDNVLDNAIKYSPDADVLLVRASAKTSMIHIEIAEFAEPGISLRAQRFTVDRCGFLENSPEPRVPNPDPESEPRVPNRYARR
jgi:K+-sensing histidine kinase KdpD